MQKIKLILSSLIIFLLVLSGCTAVDNNNKNNNQENIPAISETLKTDSKIEFQKNASENHREFTSNGGLIVHFIDVGQGDSILIELSSGENILIDAGDSDKSELVLNYLKANQVEHIHYLIATHPHADHIGGMPTVINNLSIGKVYMPKATHTTQTYENLLLSIKQKGLKILEAKAGVELGVSDMFNASFVAPNSSSYESLNDYSAVLKLSYKNHTFLFTGDAEDVSGQEILQAGHDIRAHIMQVPHHGSSNSALNKTFLQAVSPAIAVISVGADNRYGHPHKQTLELLENEGVHILRTDIDGTIIIISDGNKLIINQNIKLDNEKAGNVNTDITKNNDKIHDEISVEYIGNKNSKVFHLPSCRSLPAEHNRIYFKAKEDAIEKDFRPCGNCNP